MKILIFNWRDIRHAWAGGGEVYIFEQASRWVKMGHEITIFCGQNIDNNLPHTETIDGVRIYRKGGRYTLYFWAIWYYITRFKEKVDIVIDVQNGIPFFTPLFCRIPRICFVYHIHGNQFFYEIPFPINYIGFFIEKYIFPLLYLTTHIIAISETTKKQLTDIGFRPEKITIIHCGVNESKPSKKLVEKFSNPTILYLGRIKKYKRVDLLVKILPQILEKVPQARLIIAGWGTEASMVTDLAMKSPLRRKISLMGPVSNQEKKSLLSKSWVFVNPSIGEGWSIAVIEANAYGTPAIAFKVPGLLESIKDGETGMLAKDKDELIEKICTLLTNKLLREKLSINATTWAHSFDWSRAALKSIELLEQIRSAK